MNCRGALIALITAAMPTYAFAAPIPDPALSPGSKPDTLCGIAADSVKAFQDKAAADPRFKADPPAARQLSYASEALQALWTFTTAKHPAHPAAICRQIVDRGSVSALEMRIRCEAKTSACEDFFWEQKKLDDGAGD
jgi:hypothetical protein